MAAISLVARDSRDSSSISPPTCCRRTWYSIWRMWTSLRKTPAVSFQGHPPNAYADIDKFAHLHVAIHPNITASSFHQRRLHVHEARGCPNTTSYRLKTCPIRPRQLPPIQFLGTSLHVTLSYWTVNTDLDGRYIIVALFIGDGTSL